MEATASKHQTIMETLKKLLPKSTEEVMNILKEKDPNGVLESSVLSLVSNTSDVLFVNNDDTNNQEHCDDLQSNMQPDANIDNSNRPNGGDGEVSQTCNHPLFENNCSNNHRHNLEASKQSDSSQNPDIQNICVSSDRHSNQTQVNKPSKTDFLKCRESCEILIDYIWEKLNTGYWKDVPVAWRYAYTFVSMLKMFAEIHLLVDGDSEVKFSDVMKTCDMGLLMGAPLLDNILAKMSACITTLNPDCINFLLAAPTNNVDISPKTKRQKLSNMACLFIHDPLCSLDETKSIERVSCPSLESFQNNFLNTRVPVIITDAIDFWPAMSNRKWTLDYIKSVAGTRTVPIEIGSKYTEDSWSQTLMTIKDFIEKHIEHPCENNSTAKGYLAQHQLFDQIPELQNDISVPTYCCLGQNDDVDTNAWFGPKGTVSPLHYDDKDNLLTQVFGSKYIRLYSDEFTPCIYPHPHRLLHNTSQVDVEQPNYHQYPKFKTAPYTECILNPGEMLFIPAKFWHFVKSLSVSFSVSFWWQ